MKRFLLSIIFAIVYLVAVNAEPIDVQKAISIARTTLLANIPDGAKRASMANAKMNVVLQDKLQTEPAWYIVTPASGKGFVIVSGDDAEDAVIGFSTENSADAESLPPALRDILDGYSAHVALVRQGLTAPIESDESENETTAIARIPSAVTPLISAQWCQAAPFYNLCPTIDGTNCLVGCVALSMAQVMHHFQYPTYGTGTVTTRAANPQIESIDLDNTVFDYANMLDDYSGEYTEEQANAVAMLCLACGYAVDVEYGVNWTSAYQDTQCDVLINKFGYSHTTRIIGRYGTALKNDTKWKKRLKEELAAGRPIILSGTHPSAGAHNFICDGYKSLTFHINWGWGPKKNGINYNGYYKITELTLPDGTGAYTPGDFTIGITPAVEGEDTFTQYFIAANDSVTDYEASGSDIALTLPTFTNATYHQVNGSLYYTITDAKSNNQGKINLMTFSIRAQKTGSAYDISATLPEGLADGTYYLSLAFKPDRSDTFQKIESMYNKTNLAVTLLGGEISTINALTDDEVASEMATGIIEVKGQKSEVGSQKIYNIAGQEVSNPQHGLFIKNGKKVLFK